MSLFTLPILEELNRADNKLSGQLQEFTNASSTLQSVLLHGNNLQGKLPKSLADLSTLMSLYLGSNNFDDSLVELELFGHLQNLTDLDLSGINMLIFDQIADSSRLFPSLTVLELNSCNLTTIPSFLKHSKNVEYLDLSNNRINGAIPNWICSSSLFYLNLSSNLFTSVEGSFSNSSTGSVFIDLHSNLLQGLIPLPLPNSILVDYSNNLFTSSIPFNISYYLKKTTFFSLSNNSLTGEVPSSICTATKLYIFYISHNNLSSSIPACLLESLIHLGVLHARENSFQGSMMAGICESNRSFVNLQIFDISSNHFTGSLPSECFKSMKAMMVHQGQMETIGYRDISLGLPYYQDTITVDLKGFEMKLVKILTTFTFINLSDNQFVGNIPQVFGDLKSLHCLNMSLNGFTSEIPRVLGDMSDLEALDLSRNQLSRVIPSSLTSLTFLEFLNLSNNNLVGRVPQIYKFSTFSNSSFEGNLGLCWSPLSKDCINSTSVEPSSDSKNAPAKFDMDEIWFWMFTGLGYGVGFAAVIIY
ncbi:Leucine-rich repeat protein [Dioscorea alata]|uniref:Leucine-rich repeat protein n=1 Tax=Dioscorea alata TaxID=55571 RepID=A0ACB7VSH0_DIOAL|nr:Leucine-rich repeat protein [Dioscorea alata]